MFFTSATMGTHLWLVVFMWSAGALQLQNSDGQLPRNLLAPDMAAIYGETDLFPEGSLTVQDVENVTLPAEGHEKMFMYYIPDKNVVVCACAKCGSTSFYEHLYHLEFGTPWEYGDTAPYAQDMLSERWKDKVVAISNETMQDDIMGRAYSFALVRDPKERILSAWKSKIACDDTYGVDKHDRSYLVRDRNTGISWPRGFVFGIQRLYGAEENFTCLDLPTFVDALVRIKDLGRSKYLDQHFLPQDEGCFYKYPASKWSRVTTITGQTAFEELSRWMGNESVEMLVNHRSTAKVPLSKEIVDKLDYVTKAEYEMLSPYLPDGYQSQVAAGSFAIETRNHPHLVP